MRRIIAALVAVVLFFGCNGRKYKPLRFEYIQDMIYNPFENAYFVEYKNVFEYKDIPRFERDYVAIDIDESVFYQLLKDKRDKTDELRYRIKARYVKEINDYILEIVKF